MNDDIVANSGCWLFIDGSSDPKSKIGYGACLTIENGQGALAIKHDYSEQVQVKRFEGTSSTKLELQTFIWAIEKLQSKNCTINIYTDCQNIFSLLNRRSRLEENDFQSRKNKLISNAELYKKFFNIIDTYQCNFHKVEGHKASKSKGIIDRIFANVDKASRRALRQALLT